MSLSGSRAGLTLREMMHDHDIGLRTLQRLLRAIERACGTLEEVGTDEREKRWRMRPTPITRAIAVRAEEVAEIESAARRLADEGLQERATTLRSAAAHMRAMATEVALRRAEPDVEAILASEGIAARPGPRIVLADRVIADLRRAILGSRCILLQYRRADGQEREYLLEPYGLLYGNRPYLLALRQGKPDVAVWRLDRIMGLRDGGAPFTPRPGFTLETLTAACFGIWRETPFDVVLRFSPDVARDAKAWRFHVTQTAHDEPDGSVILRVHAGGMEEMVAHLALWGSTVTVLEPRRMAQRLAELGRDLLDHHDGANGSAQTPLIAMLP